MSASGKIHIYMHVQAFKASRSIQNDKMNRELLWEMMEEK
jgi:hypothetical protein